MRGFTGVDGASSSLCQAGEAGASRSAHDARQSMFISASVPAQPKPRSSCRAALAGLCSALALQDASWDCGREVPSDSEEHFMHKSALQTRQPTRQCPSCALPTPCASLMYLQQLP